MPKSSSMLTDAQPRRNSYQMAIESSTKDPLPYLYSSSSSLSFLNEPIDTTQSLYTIPRHCVYCLNEYVPRSTSQPVVRLPDSDFLLENATFLLDSPVHALRPARYKSCGTLSPTQTSFEMNDTVDYSTSPVTSISSIYRTVFLRSFASAFVLASLFTIEVLQTSLYPMENSFQFLLTFHLSSSIAAFIFSAHTSYIELTRHRWKISSVLIYDRCSRMCIILSTLLTSTWIISQYFHWLYDVLLITASISGVSLSCMMIRTFDHLLQLSTSSSMEQMKTLSVRFNIFIFIHNIICHSALTIGGTCLLSIVLFQQWNDQYILTGSPSCLLIPCWKSGTASLPINLTMYTIEKKQIWYDNPTRYVFVVALFSLTLISLIIQTSTKWSTSFMTLNRRLSILYYTLNDRSKIVHCFFALFIGFQEGFIFGNVLKFDVTCLYGLRHAFEMIISYGLGATISSILIALVIKRITLMTSTFFTTLLHSITLILLYLIRTQNELTHLQPLTIRYILFFISGMVVGLWSTIAINSICRSTKLSSSFTLAQSLALRYLGRLLAYTSILFLCQFYLFYLMSICLFCLFSFILISHCCCCCCTGDS